METHAIEWDMDLEVIDWRLPAMIDNLLKFSFNDNRTNY